MSLWVIAYDAGDNAVCSSWGNGNAVGTATNAAWVEGEFDCDSEFYSLKLNVERVDDGAYSYASSNLDGTSCGLAGQFYFSDETIDTTTDGLSGVQSLGWSTGTSATTPEEGCDAWYYFM